MLDRIFDYALYRKNRGYILFLMDSIIVMTSYLIAYWAKVEFAFRVSEQVKELKIPYFAIFVLVIYALSFFVFKIYKSLWIYISSVEIIRLTLANVFATAIIMLVSLSFMNDLFYLSVEFIAGILAILMMFSMRITYRLLRRHTVTNKTSKENRKNTLILGAGDAGNLMLKEIQQNPALSYNVVGFVDDRRANMMVSGLPVLGMSTELSALKEKHHIEVVIIAIQNISKQRLRVLVEKVQKAKLELKMMRKSEDMINDNPLERKAPVQDVSIEDLLGRGEVRLDQQEIRDYIHDKVVCVTGAGGSIGSELCRQIVKFEPNILLMVDINENALYMLEQEFIRNKMHNKLKEDIAIMSIVTSIRDKDALDGLFETYPPDVVYHAAAHKHVPLMETRPLEAIKNNVFGTHNVIQTCIRHKVPRFIMISTDKAVNPTNVMGASKRMTEMILQAYGDNGVTKLAAVRFGNVLGSNGSVIPIFKKQIEEGGPITITDKNIIRYFMTIPEASQLVLQAGYYANEGEIFVLDMGEPVKILDLAEKLIRLSGFEPYDEIDIKEVGLRPGEKMFEELHLRGETCETTKNDLIFKNNVMKIERNDIESMLEKLTLLVGSKDIPNSKIKERILDLIISD